MNEGKLGLLYDITIKKRARKVLDALDSENHNAAKIISDRIVALSEDPYTPRPGMDIALIKDSNPRKHRLRIGAQTRIEFMVNDLTHIVDVQDIIITKRRNTDYKM
ncbi:Uncharacterised protein [uncultured archaeon]|nr:Uncharacterised protein [uncultured archaeon]